MHMMTLRLPPISRVAINWSISLHHQSFIIIVPNMSSLLLRIPFELITQIATYLDPSPLLRLVLTCRSLHTLLHSLLLDAATSHVVQRHSEDYEAETVLVWAARLNNLALVRMLIEEKGMKAAPEFVYCDIMQNPLLATYESSVDCYDVQRYLHGCGASILPD